LTGQLEGAKKVLSFGAGAMRDFFAEEGAGAALAAGVGATAFVWARVMVEVVTSGGIHMSVGVILGLLLGAYAMAKASRQGAPIAGHRA
jgi:hypothetical protein